LLATLTPLPLLLLPQATVAVLLGFGYMIDVMFGVDLSFEFDPNADNWRRKTDPQN